MQQLHALLLQSGLGDWWPVLSQWLPNFDGWRAVMEAEEEPGAVVDDEPAQEIVGQLQRYVDEKRLVGDAQFAGDVAQADFVCWSSRLTRSRQRWCSFDMRFHDFAAIEPDEVPHVFEHEPDCPSLAKYWLLGRLFEVKLERRDAPLLNGAQHVSTT